MVQRIQDTRTNPVPLALKRLQDTTVTVVGRHAPTLRYTPVQSAAVTVDELLRLISRLSPEHKIVQIKQAHIKNVTARLEPITNARGRSMKRYEAKRLFSYLAATLPVSGAFYSKFILFTDVLYKKFGELMYGRKEEWDGISDEFEFMFGRNSPHSILHLVTPEARMVFNKYKTDYIKRKA